MIARRLLSPTLVSGVAILAICAALGFGISGETPVGAIKGRAVAQESGNPIRASVQLTSAIKGQDKQYYSTTCDVNGTFSITDLPIGNYVLRIDGKAHHLAPTGVAIEESKTQTMEVELAPGSPELKLYVHQHICTPDEHLHATCEGFTTESDTISLSIYKVDTDKFLLAFGASMGRLLGRDRYNESRHKTDLTANTALTFVRSLSQRVGRRDAEGTFTQRIDLPQLPPGLYIASAEAEGVQNLEWLLVTRLGLVTKSDGRRTLAYVVDLKSGTPVADVEVGIYAESRVVSSGKTDTDGLASIATSTEGYDQKIVARHGDSIAFLSTYSESPEASGQTIYAYTDRPVYRPGQRVFFKGILRNSSGDKYTVPAGTPVTVEVRDSRDTLIYRGARTADKFGSYYGSLPLNTEAATGYYNLVSTVPGGKRGHECGFRVAEYRKPEFSVKVTFPEKRYTRGDTVRAKITASYYFGGPVANADLHYYIDRSPYWLYGEDEDFEGYDDYGGYGETVKQGDVRTDENGEVEVEFPADWKQSRDEYDWDSDQQFTVNASITDKSGQEVSADASVLATRGDFSLSVTPDCYVVSPGDKIGVQLLAMDYDRKPIRNRELQLTISRRTWSDDGEYHVRTLERKTTNTDASGAAQVELTASKAGDLNIVATATDDHGNKIEATGYVWCYGGAYEEYEGGRMADLQIVTDKKTYRPGDTAKILINTSKPGATALVTIEGDRIYDHRTVPLKGRSTLVEMPVRDVYKPNFYVGVCFVKNKQFSEQYARAKVSLQLQKLNISISSNKRLYKPEDEAVYKLKATDSHGRPAVAQLSVGVVDEAIYAIAEDETTPILDYFYSHKENSVSTRFSFPEIYLSDPDKAGEPKMKSEARNIRIRKRFLDTAFWQPNVVTNAQGEATVRFRMPDNLTSWRTTVRGITAQTTCGQARSNVRVRQDLLVRLEMPRFLVQSDTASIAAVVHNYTGKSQRVRVSLRAPGLRIDGNHLQEVTIDNGDAERIDWTAIARKPGTFDITVTADAGKTGDAMQLALPVFPHGEQRQAITTGALGVSAQGVVVSGLQVPKQTQHAAETLQVRNDSIPEATRLRIRLAPSLAATMLGSLDYLAQYPYGCTEQTTSSFIPDVVLYQSMRDVGVINAKLQRQLPDMVNKGLFRLYRFQLEDGGWAWCEYGKADPWMTAYVCFGLLKAREAGFTLNKDILERGLSRLAKTLYTQFASGLRVPKQRKLDTNTLAYQLYVLALSGRDVSDQVAQLTQYRLSGYANALLAMASEKLGHHDWAISALDRAYMQATADPSFIRWPGQYPWDYGAAETTALALQATLQIDPTNPRIPRIVRWLMQARGFDCWYSTRETAAVLYAMAEYLKATHELAPDFRATVKVNGKLVANLHFDKASVFEPDVDVPVPPALLKKGPNTIEFEKSGAGSLYYSAELTQYIARKSIPALVSSAGISVERTYYKPPPQYTGGDSVAIGPPVTGCDSGDVVLVRLVVRSSKHFERMLLEDYIPAGCEIVDRGHVDYWEWDYWYSGRDVRDEKISFYLDSVEPGKHVVEYRMRAGFPGAYHAIPAQVFGMYEPRIRAATAETEFDIR